jgi:hypothetical protein
MVIIGNGVIRNSPDYHSFIINLSVKFFAYLEGMGVLSHGYCGKTVSKDLTENGLFGSFTGIYTMNGQLGDPTWNVPP